MNPAFERYIGIAYSGAETPRSSLKGLRVYAADRLSAPLEVMPPPSPRWYWTRRGLAEWLVERLSEGSPALVGIDHGFSFPLRYFEEHNLPLDWPSFLDDFQRHWPTDEDIYVDFVRDGSSGNGAARSGNPRWRRITELRTRTAKSVFQFDVQGAVAKSTHAGIPWLRYIRQHTHTKDRVHFWPFDGWSVPTNGSVVAEVYPSLWGRTFPTAWANAGSAGRLCDGRMAAAGGRRRKSCKVLFPYAGTAGAQGGRDRRLDSRSEFDYEAVLWLCLVLLLLSKLCPPQHLRLGYLPPRGSGHDSFRLL